MAAVTGAAIFPPPPPFSIITVMAYGCAASAAKPVNHACGLNLPEDETSAPDQKLKDLLKDDENS